LLIIFDPPWPIKGKNQLTVELCLAALAEKIELFLQDPAQQVEASRGASGEESLCGSLDSSARIPTGELHNK
jgi:hypothetical protein